MPEWLMTSIGYIGALAVGYAAIRADLARLHEKTAHAIQSADRAHIRIDGFLEHVKNNR